MILEKKSGFQLAFTTNSNPLFIGRGAADILTEFLWLIITTTNKLSH